MSFKSVIENPNYEETVHKMVNNFYRNDSSDEYLSVHGKIFPPQNKPLFKPLKILSILNTMYKERVQKTRGIVNDPELIITIYEEWNENLKKYCWNVIEMMEELKKDACMQLDGLGDRLNNSMLEISKQSVLREDRDNLVELIKRTFNDSRGWDVNGLKFHTITLADIFGENFEAVLYEENAEPETKEVTKPADQTELAVQLDRNRKKMAQILKDNDLLKSEISYLKRNIKKGTGLKNK